MADTETGVVQASFYFAQREKYGSLMFSLWMHEYFKVEADLIPQVYAVMEPLFKDGFVDVWGGGEVFGVRWWIGLVVG